MGAWSVQELPLLVAAPRLKNALMAGLPCCASHEPPHKRKQTGPRHKWRKSNREKREGKKVDERNLVA